MPEVDQERQLAVEAATICGGGYWQSLGQAQFFRNNPEAWDECAAMMRFVLQAFRDETNKLNTSFQLVVLPTLRQVHPETDSLAYDAAVEHLQLTEHDLQVDDRAAELVVRLASDLQISLVDMREPLLAAFQHDKSHELYWRFDHHLNIYGHQVLAEHLLPILAKEFQKRATSNPE
ncbi:MAG: hypothetical protein R3C05_29560 [Pirellulaceae bacterium]